MRTLPGDAVEVGAEVRKDKKDCGERLDELVGRARRELTSFL